MEVMNHGMLFLIPRCAVSWVSVGTGNANVLDDIGFRFTSVSFRRLLSLQPERLPGRDSANMKHIARHCCYGKSGTERYCSSMLCDHIPNPAGGPMVPNAERSTL